MSMPVLQQYPFNFNPISNVEDIDVFLTRKVFTSNHFFIETANKNEQFKSTKHGYLIQA